MRDERRDRVNARPVPEYVHIVDHEHYRDLHHRQRGGQAWDQDRFGPSSRGSQSFKHRGRDRLDLIERPRDVTQEHNGVVVPFVERHPREGPFVGTCPLGDERCLAVARPGKDRHDRHFS